MFKLRFESTLPVSRAQAWHWITDPESLLAEMRPLLKMTMPAGQHSLESVTPGAPLFTSWLWLFGLLPMGTSRLTLTRIDPGQGFVEQSPMTSMRFWRHERRIENERSNPPQVLLVDELTVEPLLASWVTRTFLKVFFTHRHRVLRRRAAQWVAPAASPADKPAKRQARPAPPPGPKKTGSTQAPTR
ncbi:MAG: hypothetical protein ABWY06_12890 [Pseudomonas sp.]|uniref:hypothetical protein n=1 Tax=Pseudomonas sp. TaxID=306 RepID=UPI0033960F19